MGRLPARAVLLLYPLLALAAYPVSEYLVAGTWATVYGFDVFDDGSVSRLGALAPNWPAHGLALWNPYLTTGNAWFSQFALPPIAPDSLLSLLLTPFQSFVAIQAMLPLVAGVAMHVFARRSLRLPMAAALAAGIVYALSLWHYPIGLAGPALPLLVLLVDRPSGRAPLAVAAVAAVLTVVLHQGLLQVAMLAGGVQLAWIFLVMPRAERGRRLWTWFWAWLLAGLIYAPTLLSLAVALPESHRAIWDVAPHLSPREALDDLVRRYAGLILAMPRDGGWGLHAAYEGTWFIGLIGLPLALLGASRAAFAGPRHQFAVLMLIAIPLVDLVSVLAGPMLEQAGPLGSFQLSRVRHFVPFTLAVAVGIGLTSIGALGHGRRTRRWSTRLVLVAGVTLVALQIPAVLGRFGELPVLGETVAPAWLRASWLVGGALGIAGVILLARRRSGRLATLMVVLLLSLVAVERGAYLRVERGILPYQLSSWQARLAETLIVERVRIETVRDGSRALSTGLYPNRLLFHRVRSVTGYVNAYPLRTHELLDVLFAPYLDQNRARADYFRKWGNRAVAFEPIWARQVVDLLGARWIISDQPIDEVGMVAVMTEGERYLYRNEEALPRAFVVTAERTFAGRDDLHEALAAADTDDLANTAFLERSLLGTGGGPPGSARFTTDEADQLEIEVESPAPGILIVADAYMPGWVATVNGQAAKVHPAYGALRAVEVPAGSSTVILSYEPLHTRIGLGASAVGLLALVALPLIGRRRG